MTVKNHYDNHLAKFYSWMLGDFDLAKDKFKDFCQDNDISPSQNKTAIDLGAGNGVQTIALAELGFKVKAIDFNKQLLTELKSKINNHDIEVIEDDIINVQQFQSSSPELIICCGDTISHLENFEQLNNLINDSFNCLSPGGKLVLTFRDYSHALNGTDRFIPVKSDDNRILTCVIDFFEDKIKVTDLLHEKTDEQWRQKVSSYNKIRITNKSVYELLMKSGFTVLFNSSINRMEHIVARK